MVVFFVPDGNFLYLVVVGLTVGEAFPLVVPISQERLLTLEIVKLRILFFIHLVQTKFFLHTVVQTKFFFLPWHKQSFF